MKKKLTVGLIEKIKIIGNKKTVESLAKFDTGARSSSIDTSLAAEAGLNVVASAKVTAASVLVSSKRPVVEVVFKINGRKYKTRANITDRDHMTFPVLIGRNLIHSNFVVDIEKTHLSHKEIDLKPDMKARLAKFFKE